MTYIKIQLHFGYVLRTGRLFKYCKHFKSRNFEAQGA